ncbi:hypothetical protein R3P38DRAFT_2804958 [Favolaschia claudopus]
MPIVPIATPQDPVIPPATQTPNFQCILSLVSQVLHHHDVEGRPEPGLWIGTLEREDLTYHGYRMAQRIDDLASPDSEVNNFTMFPRWQDMLLTELLPHYKRYPQEWRYLLEDLWQLEVENMKKKEEYDPMPMTIFQVDGVLKRRFGV